MSITKLKLNEVGDATILVVNKGGLVTLYVEEVSLLAEVPADLAFDAILISGPRKGYMRANPQAWCWDVNKNFGTHFGYLALVRDYIDWRFEVRAAARPPIPPPIRPRILEEELITEPSPCEWWVKVCHYWQDQDEFGDDCQGEDYETFGPFQTKKEAIAAGKGYDERTVWCVAK